MDMDKMRNVVLLSSLVYSSIVIAAPADGSKILNDAVDRGIKATEDTLKKETKDWDDLVLTPTKKFYNYIINPAASASAPKSSCADEATMIATIVAINDPNNTPYYMGAANQYYNIETPTCGLKPQDQIPLFHKWGGFILYEQSIRELMYQYKDCMQNIMSKKNDADSSSGGDNAGTAFLSGSKSGPDPMDAVGGDSKCQIPDYSRKLGNLSVDSLEDIRNKMRDRTQKLGKALAKVTSNSMYVDSKLKIWLKGHRWYSQKFNDRFKRVIEKDTIKGKVEVVVREMYPGFIEDGTEGKLNNQLQNYAQYAKDLLDYSDMIMLYQSLESYQTSSTSSTAVMLQSLFNKGQKVSNPPPYIPFKLDHGFKSSGSGPQEAIYFFDNGDGSTTRLIDKDHKNEMLSKRQGFLDKYRKNMDKYIAKVNKENSSEGLLTATFSELVTQYQVLSNKIDAATWRLNPDDPNGAKWLALIKNGYPSEVERQEAILLAEIRAQLADNQRILTGIMRNLTLMVYKQFRENERSGMGGSSTTAANSQVKYYVQSQSDSDKKKASMKKKMKGDIKKSKEDKKPSTQW